MKLLKMGIPAMIAVGGLAYLVLSGSSNGSSNGSTNGSSSGSSNGAKGASGRGSSGSSSSHTHSAADTSFTYRGKTASTQKALEELFQMAHRDGSNRFDNHTHTVMKEDEQPGSYYWNMDQGVRETFEPSPAKNDAYVY